MRSLTVTMIAARMLAGCASGPPPMPAPIPRLPPADLLMPLPDLPPPRSGQLLDLLLNHIQVAELYQDCRERQRALADWAAPDRYQEPKSEP